MGIRLVTPPLAEPVSLAEAKVHLEVQHDNHDEWILHRITAARALIEGQLDRALVTQTWELTLDNWTTWNRWSYARVLTLPLPPLVSVEAITYLGTNGVLFTLGPDQYRVSPGSPGRIVLAPGKGWPLLYPVPDAVTVRFVAGYGDPNQVPEPIRLALLLLLGHWYQNREAVLTSGNNPIELPIAVQSLLATENWGSYP